MSEAAARVSRWVTRLEEGCLAWGVLGIAALTIANVVGRAGFGHSLAFAEELAQLLVVLVTFVGLAHAAAKGRHIRMTALYDALPPRPKKALRVMICATTSLLLFYLAYLGGSYALGTVRALGSVSPALEVPLWLAYLAAPLGLAVAGVEYALALYKNLTSEGVWLSFEVADDAPREEAR
ncbi:MAG: TRAP transporter small permease [Sandaracinaceae bacterium]|nr:TRAP transporter small permease [Sandaracinaceae bacterium]